MNKLVKEPNFVNVIAQLADLKEVDYKNILALSALIELLIEKGIITRKEMVEKTEELDHNPLLNELNSL